MFTLVISSAVGAHATTQSRDPEEVGCNDAATGSSYETKNRIVIPTSVKRTRAVFSA
jgi:hypothetical protein